MNIDQVDTEYYVYLMIWFFGPMLLFAFLARGGRLAGLFVFTYVLGFFTNHWMGALVHATSPELLMGSQDTVRGFHLSTYALLSLMLGVVLVRDGTGSYLRSTRFGLQALSDSVAAPLEAAAYSYLAIGAVFWIVAFTPLATLPSASAVISAGRQCFLLGISLLVWGSWQRGNKTRYRGWLFAVMALPVLTVLTQGFIGYGISMLTLITVFMAMYYRPRWHLVAGIFTGIFVAMSLWVAYAAHREAIRKTVWGGESYAARADAMLDMLASLEPFDTSNASHVAMIDVRLNQNVLVGQAMRITPDFVPYQYGKTIFDALVAVIPRAIWPDKPIVGGSADYVARHTMQQFAVGTSVGMGQVLEFYINFGIECVLVGFLLLGMLLRYIDIRMSDALVRGHVPKLQFYFLVGSGALQAGGSLSEIVASMAGGAVISFAITRFLASGYYSRSAKPRRI